MPIRSKNETRALNSLLAEVVALRITLRAFMHTFPDLTDGQLNTFRHQVCMSQQKIKEDLDKFVYFRNSRQGKYS